MAHPQRAALGTPNVVARRAQAGAGLWRGGRYPVPGGFPDEHGVIVSLCEGPWAGVIRRPVVGPVPTLALSPGKVPDHKEGSDDDEDSGYSGESSSGNDPGDVGVEIQAFLRRVRFVKDLFSYCYISCIDYVGHLAESASDSTNKLNGRCSVVLNLSYRPAVWLP